MTVWRDSGGQRVEADVDKIESVNAILFVQKKRNTLKSNQTKHAHVIPRHEEARLVYCRFYV
jgi:hypothetical protein